MKFGTFDGIADLLDSDGKILGTVVLFRDGARWITDQDGGSAESMEAAMIAVEDSLRRERGDEE